MCLSTGLLDSCTDSDDCAPGFECLPVEGADYNWCQATMPQNEIGTPCAYDCDCAAGMSCVTLRVEDGPSCQIKCRGNQDCPRSSLCDDPGNPAGPNNLVCR